MTVLFSSLSTLILNHHKAVQMFKIKSPFGYYQRLLGRDRQTWCLAMQHKFPTYVPASTLCILTLLEDWTNKSQERDTGPRTQFTSRQLPLLGGSRRGRNEGWEQDWCPGLFTLPNLEICVLLPTSLIRRSINLVRCIFYWKQPCQFVNSLPAPFSHSSALIYFIPSACCACPFYLCQLTFYFSFKVFLETTSALTPSRIKLTKVSLSYVCMFISLSPLRRLACYSLSVWASNLSTRLNALRTRNVCFVLCSSNDSNNSVFTFLAQYCPGVHAKYLPHRCAYLWHCNYHCDSRR